MYKIIGGDQKEYGPVSSDQIRAWLREGRVSLQTKVQSADGGDWKSLSEIPELAGATSPPITAAPPLVAATSGATKTSGMAITSLVLGILALCGGITALAGLPLGIIALSKIKKSNGQLTGQGLAIAGICLSGMFLLFIPIQAGLLLPAISKARERAMTIKCVNNVKQLGLAVRIYATDKEDKFPPAATWCDAIQNDVGAPGPFQCPAHKEQRCGYAFNPKLSGKKADEVNPGTVLIFESDGGWNASGGVELMLKNPRHGRHFVVGFADGSVQQLTQEQLVGLRWEP